MKASPLLREGEVLARAGRRQLRRRRERVARRGGRGASAVTDRGAASRGARRESRSCAAWPLDAVGSGCVRHRRLRRRIRIEWRVWRRVGAEHRRVRRRVRRTTGGSGGGSGGGGGRRPRGAGVGGRPPPAQATGVHTASAAMHTAATSSARIRLGADVIRCLRLPALGRETKPTREDLHLFVHCYGEDVRVEDPEPRRRKVTRRFRDAQPTCSKCNVDCTSATALCTRAPTACGLRFPWNRSRR